VTLAQASRGAVLARGSPLITLRNVLNVWLYDVRQRGTHHEDHAPSALTGTNPPLRMEVAPTDGHSFDLLPSKQARHRFLGAALPYRDGLMTRQHASGIAMTDQRAMHGDRVLEAGKTVVAVLPL
jgi:hypothetical protein